MSKRHHTVPRSFLLGFSDQKGRLHAFDRQKQCEVSLSINDATVVAGFYLLHVADENGIDSGTIESLLSDLEGLTAPILSRIRKGESPVREEDEPTLASFIAMQLVRTTRHRHWGEELGDWYAKVWFEGMTRKDVMKRFKEKGIEATDQAIDAAMDVVNHPERYQFIPPKNDSLLSMLTTHVKLLGHLSQGWNWIVVRSSRRPFLTSDYPVVMVGDSVNGGLGVASAAEIWMPVGRHHAVVLTKDASLPPVLLDLPSDHIRRLCHRIAYEAHRWVYWHPKDQPLEGIHVPRRDKNLIVESMGSRQRDDGTVGEIVRFGSPRPVIPGETLLSGRPVTDRRAIFDGPITGEQLFPESRPPDVEG